MRLSLASIATLASIGALWAALPSSSNAASFDCARARAPDERAICGNRALEDRDVKMATLYSVNRRLAGGMGALGAMRDRQRDWLGERTRCRSDTTCIRAAYDRRITELERGLDVHQGR